MPRDSDCLDGAALLDFGTPAQTYLSLRLRLSGEYVEQRRLRLGDILDDYCPRERRITNHAVVAMIDDGVKQTRCTTCDAEHVYRAARVLPKRMKKARLTSEAGGSTDGRAPVAGTHADTKTAPTPAPISESADADAGATSPAMVPRADETLPGDAGVEAPEPLSDLGNERVRRSLIRATLPRVDGQPPVRPARGLTVRSAAARGNGLRNGDSRGGSHGNRQGTAAGARHPGARPAWPARATSGRPVLSHHPSRRSPNGSQLHARQPGKAWPARHGKKRSK